MIMVNSDTLRLTRRTAIDFFFICFIIEMQPESNLVLVNYNTEELVFGPE